MKNILLSFTLIFTFCIEANSQKSVVKKDNRPNIVFILADDLGYGDIGINGQKLIKTPNIDRLAKQGVRFTQFYAGTSVCAPSRSALLSGQHTGHTYIRGNKGVDPEGQAPIADSVLTVAEILQKSGYQTVAFGKWGLGPVGSEGDPNKQGFDHFFGYNCQSLAHRYYPNHLWDNGKKIVLEANENLTKNKEYAPDIIQSKALDFVKNRDKNKPFFLFLPYILPHAELIVPEDSIFLYYKGKFEEQPYKGKDYGINANTTAYVSQAYPHATFAAMVTRLDLYVGQILDKLKAEGLDNNTLVIFTSDNGPHREGGADPVFFNSGGGFKGFKRDLYEGGIREPFIVRWTNTIQPNSTNNHIGAFWDILPTFTDIAGVKSPKNIDGISFLSSLKGRANQKTHGFLYWEFHENGGIQAVRQGNWKAVKLNAAVDKNAEIELYDLSKDPQESKNIAKLFPEKAKELSKLMNSSHTESQLFPFVQNGK